MHLQGPCSSRPYCTFKISKSHHLIICHILRKGQIQDHFNNICMYQRLLSFINVASKLYRMPCFFQNMKLVKSLVWVFDFEEKIDFKKEIICIFYKFIYKYSLMFILEINIRGYLSYVRKDMLVWLSNPLLNQMKNSEKSYISSFKRTFLWQFIIEKTIYEWMNSILIRIPSLFGVIRKCSISKSSQIPTL